jgi:hypothetical protein
VSNGSKNTLLKFTEDARVVGVQIARNAESGRVDEVNGVDAKTINHAKLVAYAKKRDNDILDRIKTLIQEESRKNARRAEVVELMKVNGVDVKKTVAESEMEDYATTGEDDILERIKMTIQEEKNRLDRRKDRRKVFRQTLLKYMGGKDWIIQVPEYVWKRNAIIQEYLENGTGEDVVAVEDACSAIVSVLRAVKEKGEEKSKEDGSKAIHKYATKLDTA